MLQKYYQRGYIVILNDLCNAIEKRSTKFRCIGSLIALVLVAIGPVYGLRYCFDIAFLSILYCLLFIVVNHTATKNTRHQLHCGPF